MDLHHIPTPAILPSDCDQVIRKLQHDARSPLTAIQVYTECLLDDPDLSEQQEHDLRQILKEVRRLTAVLTTPGPSSL